MSTNLINFRSFIREQFRERSKRVLSLFILLILIVTLPVFIWITKERADLRQYGAETPSTPLARGVAGDQWADIVLGKKTFNETGPFATVPTRLFVPSGVFVDRSTTPNKFYIYDSGNNRILGFSNLPSCLSTANNPLNCTPDLILGQPASKPTDPGFGTSSTCNGDSAFQNYPNRALASARTLCLQREDTISLIEGGSSGSMDTDAQGNLYVVDFWNNRILKYNSPFTTDTVADFVWGQDNFTDNQCNKGRTAPDATTLCFLFTHGSWVGGVDIDAAGNLWVNDNNNHRILRFPPGSKTANYVLGQTSFITRTSGTGLNQLYYPGPVRLADNGKLYAADTTNDRVLVFSGPFDSSTLGKSGSLFGTGFIKPNAIDFDPTNPGRIWIMNNGNSVAELWDMTTSARVKEVGWRNNGNILGRSSGSIGVDSNGNIFASARLGNYMSDVLMFTPSLSLVQPTKHFFVPSNHGNLPTQDSLAGNTSVVISDNQLIVGETGRILFWNNPSSVSNGKPADGAIIGTFNSILSGCCYAMKADKNHHLWVSSQRQADLPNRIELYTLPLTNGAKPVKTITLPLPLLGGGTLSFKDDVFWGLAPTDNSEFLWVSHQSSSRVFRIRQPLSSTPVVDIVLGQVNGTDTDCNRGAPQISGATPNTLCLPTALSLDNSGNLWVADHLAEAGGNRRELVFNKSLFPTTNTTTIFAPNASRIFSNVGIWGPIFTPDGKMIVGFDPWDGFNPRNGRFVAVYNNPDTMTSFSTPDMYFNDYYSTPYALAMDSEHNVYISDLNRGRLLIYKDPLNYLKVTPTGGISPTPTPIIQSITPTSAPTLSPSLTKTPTPLPTNTPFPPTPTPTSTPINYVRIPYSLDELTGGSTINQWKNTLIYIKQNMNLNQLGFYNTGPSAKYEVRNSDRTGTIGTLVSSGNFRSTPNSANYYYQETNINFSNKKYYLIRVYPTTGTYYLGSTSKSYAALSFLKRSNGASKAQTTGSFQWRLRFTLK